MANAWRVWSGSSWATPTVHYWTGTAWSSNLPTVRYWDGQAWVTEAPPAREFAAFIASNKGNFKDVRYATIPVPPVARVSDFVVSICASMRGFPTLLSPAGHLPQVISPPDDEMSFAVACWPYTGNEGDVVWDLADSPQAACMNLLYRNGDVTNLSVTPVSDMQLYKTVDKVPLMPSRDFTSIFVALTVSRQVSSYSWPEGVLPRDAVVGRFGAYEISAFAADTPGAGASLGSLQLNTAVDAAAMYLVTIPGKSDGRPTWILGDAAASILGRTTILL
ncbi:hypothetical protein AB0M57_23925 [Streptomyces sp. NPDC051597]|uniref:hypothetical protein n=1 Tax=Streptomyces sp. NPDC051597 TaxID=3155049 RepID=UPI00341DF3DA